MKFSPEACPLCGKPNNCQLCTTAAYKGPCWCEDVSIPAELLARVPEAARNLACICRNCVMAFHQEQNANAKSPRSREQNADLLRPE